MLVVPLLLVALAAGVLLLGRWPGVGGTEAALSISVVGLVAGVIASRVYAAWVYGTPRPAWWLSVPVGAACYSLAVAMVGAVRGWWPRAAGASLCALAIVAALVQAPRTRHRAEVEALAGMPVALVSFGPSAGYRLDQVFAYPPEHAVMLGIRRRGVSDPHAGFDVLVLLIPLPNQFAPPVECGPIPENFLDRYVERHSLRSGPCDPAGIDVWTHRVEDGPQQVWLRSESGLTVLSSSTVDLAALRAVAAGLRPVSASTLARQASVDIWTGNPSRPNATQPKLIMGLSRVGTRLVVGGPG
jgi:hypothetical protein